METILSLKEYSELFQNMILAEYDHLFSNAELRRDLGLDNDTTLRFGVEYLCAAVFLLSDLIQVRAHGSEIGAQLDSDVRASVFRRIIRASVSEGVEAQYILYSLKRGMQFQAVFARDDEGIKRIIEQCLDQVGQNDPISRLPQSLYLMNLLPALAGLMGDLLQSAESRVENGKILFRIIPPEECER